MNQDERQFADIYSAKTGTELLYESATFRVSVDGTDYRYTPDFYCPKTLTFFEVVGSRQALHLDKFKIKALLERYPQLKFEIVNPDGSPHSFQGLGYRNGNSLPAVAYVPPLLDIRDLARKRLVEAVEIQGRMIEEIASGTAINPTILRKAVYGKTRRFHARIARLLIQRLDELNGGRNAAA